MEDDDEDFEPSQWRGGRWVPCGQRSQLQRPTSSQASSQRRQTQPSIQGSRDHPAPDLSAQLLSLLQSAAKATPAKEKKPRVEEKERLQCLLCASTLATQTTLFRHYKNQHNINNPARFLGYKESNVFNLDTTLEESECTVCGLVVPNSHALNVHLKTAHNTASNAGNTASNTTVNTGGNNPKGHCNECGFEANSKHELDVHSRVHASSSSGNANSAVTRQVGDASAANAAPNNNVSKALVDSLHKCDKCVCYFDDKKRFVEHMKAVHDCHAVCSICDKNMLFKDYDDHVKNSHPDVYKTKKVEGRKGRNYVKKLFHSKTGKIVGVYKCTAVHCHSELDDEVKAKGHAKLHNKRRTSRTVDREIVVNADNVDNNVAEEKDIMYTCEACKISTASYDVVVEHSQRHLVDSDPEFVSNTCACCELKLEPVCYEEHVTRHYSDDNVNRESFKHLEYKYQLLLSDDWLKSFNEEEAVINRIVSKSIYADTRCVKMRVISVTGTSCSMFNLYQCGKCKRYVDPPSVASHTRHYDTCVRITLEFPCEVCQRSFTAPKALENHLKAHDGNENFRIVVFNTDIDREFNRRLDDIRIRMTYLNTAEASIDVDNNVRNVLYKCSCLLCFVEKERADDHLKVCPGKDAKIVCHKCKNMFNRNELLPHYVRYHSSNEAASFTIEDVFPDAIDVADDEPELRSPSLVIDLCDDEEIEPSATGAKSSNTGCVEGMEISDDTETDVRNTLETHGEASVSGIRNNTQAETSSVITIKTEESMNGENEDVLSNQENDDAMAEESDGNVETDNSDSQDTLIGEHIETSAVANGESSESRNGIPGNGTGIKCVSRDSLINDDAVMSISTQARSIKKEVQSEMGIIRRQTEGNGVDSIQITNIKREGSWHASGPFNYPNISGRPPLRAVATSSVDVPTYELLTDDEDMTDDTNNDTSLNVSGEVPLNNYYQISPDQSGNLSNNETVSGNDFINTIDDTEATQDFPINEEIDENHVVDWIVDNGTADDAPNVTLTDSAVECKENLNACNILTNPVINRNVNPELEQLMKINERLIAHREENVANEQDGLYQNRGSFIKEISFRAVITSSNAAYNRKNINIGSNLNINSLPNDNGTNFISNRQIKHTYNNKQGASYIEGMAISSNNTVSIGNIAKEDKSKKALAVVNYDSAISKTETKTVVTRNEQNIETVVYPQKEIRAIRMPRRQTDNDNNCKLC